MDGVQLPQGYSHFEEALYFLPFSSQKFLVLSLYTYIPVIVYIPSPYNGFLYFLERQVHKDNELGIINNVGKSRLVKVIFTAIHNISDTCANSFVRYIMIAQCIREMFLLFIKVSLEKWCS